MEAALGEKRDNVPWPPLRRVRGGNSEPRSTASPYLRRAGWHNVAQAHNTRPGLSPGLKTPISCARLPGHPQDNAGGQQDRMKTHVEAVSSGLSAIQIKSRRIEQRLERVCRPPVGGQTR